MLLQTQDEAVQELAGLREQSEGLKRYVVLHQKDTAAARQELTASALDATRCAAYCSANHHKSSNAFPTQACA
jgi:hypothetical protein